MALSNVHPVIKWALAGLFGLIVIGMLLPDSPKAAMQQVSHEQEKNQMELSTETAPNINDSKEHLKEEQKPSEQQSNDQPSKQPSQYTTPTPAANLATAPKIDPPKPKQEASKPSCDPNYSGCVPIASDVDCAGGSGNGPAYTGRTTVIDTDIYDLDRDGDGVACE